MNELELMGGGGGAYVSQGDYVVVFPKPQQNLNLFVRIFLLFVHDLRQTDRQTEWMNRNTVHGAV